MRHKSLPILVTSIILMLLTSACNQAGETGNMTDQSKVRAPEFPKNLQWINVTDPLTFDDLKGKVVILDFWTYCCINCIHIMPDLKKLEAKYADELVVIGVHSAKFTTEKETENIRQAVLRYELEHPVVNDSEMEVWQRYAARAWPTIMLIDPEGYVVGYHSGEGIYDIFDQAVGELIEKFDEKGLIDRNPIQKIKPDMVTEQPSLLKFPGKVLLDESGNRLFIADSNNNRIVIIDLANNEVLDVIGSSDAGAEDGTFESATFDKPQGMALHDSILYIADTENHLVRKAYLKARTVETIAGIGEQASYFNRPGQALETALNSPWDLVLQKNILFIANAGSHQLWKLDLSDGYLEPHAGSGRENRVDDSLKRSQLAQPSGLATDGEFLYFADSEVSAIRSATIKENGMVTTIAGGELFVFGSNDAIGLNARFQHPLGVAYKNENLYVADTYNNSIRFIDLKTRMVTTIAGSGKEGNNDGPWEFATFDEPGGVSVGKDKLYIADTNNHLVRILDLETREVSTLMIKKLEKLASDKMSKTRTIQLEPANSGDNLDIELKLSLPEGTKLNPLAESFVSLGRNGKTIIEKSSTKISDIKISDDTNLNLDVVIFYCDVENEGLCYYFDATYEVAIIYNPQAKEKGLKINIKPHYNEGQNTTIQPIN